jgi:4-nitrophenyl phosphatase
MSLASAAEKTSARVPRYSKVVFDLDGTLYRGSTAIPHAVEAVNRLRGRAELFFLSNNSSLSCAAIAERLRELGVTVSEDEAVGSAALVADYLSSREERAAFFPVCSPSLEEVLVTAGHHPVPARQAEYVVVGVDSELTYEKLALGLVALRGKARLVAANLDQVFPVEGGVRPGAGAIVGAFRGMGFEPEVVCGKPDPWAIERAFALRGWEEKRDALMIGDQLETDILSAERIGVDSVLVLTGVSTRADIETKGIRPTYVIEDLRELEPILRGEATH